MTDNVMDDTGSVGTGGKPTQPVSPGQPGANSAGEVTLAEVLQQVKELQGHIRSLQGEKDKAVNRVQTEVRTLAEQMARYEKYRARFNDPDEAVRQMQIDDLLAQDRAGAPQAQAPQQVQAGSRPTAAGVDYTAILNSMGLDPNSPDVVRLMTENSSPVEVINGFASLKQRAERAQQQQAPVNPAPLPGAGGAAASSAAIAIAEEYESRKKTIRAGDVDALYRLKLEYREKAAKQGVQPPA